MLYHVCSWSLLTIVCLVIGVALLHRLQADFVSRRGDRLILATWLGLIALSLSFLTTALFFPLSLTTALSIALMLLVAALLSSKTRAELLSLVSNRYFLLVCTAIVCLEFLVANLINQPISWFDTGLYHMGAIRWLSRYGTVPGVALITQGFGFTSAWFALSAALLPEALGSRVGAVSNGFIFVIAILHIFISVFHILNRDRQLSDWFIVSSFSILILAYTVTIFTGSPMLISFSPDVSVAFLISILAWFFLVYSDASIKTVIAPPNYQQTRNFGGYLIPIILASGAISNKLSALPLLLIALGFCLLSTKFSLIKTLCAGILTIMLLFPMVANSIITSGCPVFPSTIACLDVPWQVSKEKAEDRLKVIGVTAADDSQEVSLPLLIKQRITWFKTQRKMQLMVLSFLLGLAASIGYIAARLRRRTYKGPAGIGWVLGLSIAGASFIMSTSPLIRFGLGYFVLIPALLGAVFLHQIFNCKTAQFTLSKPVFAFRKSWRMAIPLLCLGTSGCVMVTTAWRTQNLTWLLPTSLPEVPPLAEVQINDVTYTYPADWSVRCWDADLPCAPVPTLDDISLRNPSVGIGAGFVRSGSKP